MDNLPVISVSPEVLESIEQLMHSGIRGTHLLFSNQTIREAFIRQPDSLDALQSGDASERIHDILTELIKFDHIEERQDYIDQLDSPLRDLLVHLYFGFLDRYLSEPDEPEVVH